MAAVCPTLYLIVVASLSALALLWAPTLIDRIRGRGYNSPNRGVEMATVAEERNQSKGGQQGMDDSHSSSTGGMCLDSSSSPLTGCFGSV
jgi:hypothetical protein